MSFYIAVDVGKCFTKVANSDGFSMFFPSTVVELDDPKKRKQGLGRVKDEGKFYHVGDAALKYPRSQYKTSNDNFVLNFRTAIVYALPPGWEEGDVKVALTHAKDDRIMSPKMYNVFSLNLDDIDCFVRPTVTHIMFPGFGSYYSARLEGRNAIVLDIGYSATSVLLVECGSNTVLDVPIVIENGGTNHLFANISSNPKFRAKVNGLSLDSLDIAYRQKELLNDSVYNADKNIAHWWMSIWSSIVNNVNFIKEADIRHVYICGGGAFLIRPFIEAIQYSANSYLTFSISNNPIMGNVQGLIDYVSSRKSHV